VPPLVAKICSKYRTLADGRVGDPARREREVEDGLRGSLQRPHFFFILDLSEFVLSRPSFKVKSVTVIVDSTSSIHLEEEVLAIAFASQCANLFNECRMQEKKHWTQRLWLGQYRSLGWPKIH
jgi:hypothetical protein